MKTITCKRCHQAKPAKEFRHKDYYRTYCAECAKKRSLSFQSGFNRTSKEQSRKNSKAQHGRYRTFIDSFKTKPCADCGGTFPPYVMDFDHRDGAVKVASIGTLLTRHASFDRITKEIAKCDLVCANCHRIRSHRNKAYLNHRKN